LRTALDELYPECAIAGCHVNRHLEYDHVVPVAEGGPTELANLVGLCRFHHDQKHTLRLTVEGQGLNRRLVPRERPPPRQGRAP
jgi:5-methylcytosine-specific restriction endonuclease McrA